MSGTVHVLCGSYELLTFLNLSGQLAWRSSEVHFQRYQTNEEDLKAFREIILNLQLHLPFPVMPQLYQHWKLLYGRSIGCVGILHRWLSRALAIALDRGLDTLPEDILEESAPSPKKCKTWLEEILYGEKAFQADPKAHKKLLKDLGLDDDSAPAADEKTPKPSKGKQSVGERKPMRDPIGNRSAA